MPTDFEYVISRPDHGEHFDDGDKWESNYDDPCDIAEEYANYFHSERDGWEAFWPIAFCIYSKTGELLGEVEVERESIPSFSGTVRQIAMKSEKRGAER